MCTSRSRAGKAGTSASGRLRRAYAAFERHLRTGDRADAERLRGVRELEGGVDPVVVGERERLVAELGCPRGQLFGLGGSVQE